LSNLHFRLFTPRVLVNTRAVNFQEFQTDPSTCLTLLLKATRHAQEKMIDGGRASGAATGDVKTYYGINCDRLLEVTEIQEWNACRKVNIQQEAWPTIRSRGPCRHDCHVITSPVFRAGTSFRSITCPMQHSRSLFRTGNSAL